MRRLLMTLIAVLSLAPIMVQPALAAAGNEFPSRIALPASFGPDGITVGKGDNFYLDSSTTGAVYRGNLRTGDGQILIPPAAGKTSAAIKIDPRTNYLFVAGGPNGQATVYDAASGAQIANYQLAAQGGLVNDLVITPAAAYFTDCGQPYLYEMPLGSAGELPGQAAIRQIRFGAASTAAYVAPNSIVEARAATTAAYVAPNSVVQVEAAAPMTYVAPNSVVEVGAASPMAYVAPNSVLSSCTRIEATPDGKWLIMLNTTTGAIDRVDPNTGQTIAIDLGEDVKWADSMAMIDNVLYVVQASGQITAFRLSEDVTSGTRQQVFTEAAMNGTLHTPAQAAAFNGALYVVDTPYYIVPAGQLAPGAEVALVRVLPQN